MSDSSGSDEDSTEDEGEKSVVTVSDEESYDDDLEELTNKALESVVLLSYELLSPKSKLKANCVCCGDCGFDARGSHHSCSECSRKMMVCVCVCVFVSVYIFVMVRYIYMCVSVCV